MSRKKTHVKPGDEVQVIAGNHKGKQGKVLEVHAEKEQVVVEGVRVMKKSVRRSEENPDGGIVDKDGPIHISNVKKIEAAS
ncbi:MAG: 50S ribosomal protein L24 [Roseibacillus sp.]|nr:50S ribosomal protein L24 [Roseibacillus sp.]|tara:strand:- start:92 stop:334 length:243 start_codon:yes stop_codon:yes gene_type:complete